VPLFVRDARNRESGLAGGNPEEKPYQSTGQRRQNYQWNSKFNKICKESETQPQTDPARKAATPY